MIDYKHEVVVQRPVQDVFSLIKDVGRYDQWTEMTGTKLLSGGGIKPGSQIETTMSLGPARQTLRFEVVEYEESKLLRWKTITDGALNWDAMFAFAPLGDGSTKVTSSGKIWLGGVLKISEPLIAAEIRSGEAKELEKFKALAEAG